MKWSTPYKSILYNLQFLKTSTSHTPSLNTPSQPVCEASKQGSKANKELFFVIMGIVYSMYRLSKNVSICCSNLLTYLWVGPRSMRHMGQVFILLAQPWHVMCPLWHWRTTLPPGTVRQTGHCRISSIFALKLATCASASSILRFMESKACCNIEWG